MRWLVGVDIDDPGLIVERVARWAPPHRAVVDLMYSDPVGDMVARIANPLLQQMVSGERSANRASNSVKLRMLLGQLPRGHQGDVLLETGRPELAILSAATGYDIVFVGPHRRQQRHALGSVAEDVVRNSPVPVVIVK